MTLRLANAVRMAVALCIGYMVTMYHQGPYAYYIPLTIAMVTLPTVGSTFRQSLLRIGGIIVGGYGGLLLVQVSSHGDMPFVLTLFSITLIFMYFATYYTSSGVSAGYLFIAAYLALCLVYFPSLQKQTIAAGYDYFFRILVSALGIFIAMACSAIFWPHKARSQLQAQFQAALEDPTQMDLIEMDQSLSQAAAENPGVLRKEPLYRMCLILLDRIRSKRSRSLDASSEEKLITKLQEEMGKPIHPSRSWRIDPHRMQRALRGAALAVVSPYLAIALSWPEATATVIVAVLMAVIASTREAALKLMAMIFVSAWIACGLVTLLKVVYFPHIDRLAGLLLVVFPIVTLFAFISSGRHAIGRLFQFVPLLFAGLMLSTDTYNNPNLEPAYRWAQAFSLGAVLAALSHCILWPTTAKRRFRQLKEQVDALQREIEQTQSSGKRAARDLMRLTMANRKIVGDIGRILASLPDDKRRSLTDQLTDEQSTIEKSLDQLGARVRSPA